MTDFDKQLGSWMAQTREFHGVSQILLAEQLQMEQSTISKLEHGDRRVTVELLLHWASALDVDASEIQDQLDTLRTEFYPSAGFWGNDDT